MRDVLPLISLVIPFYNEAGNVEPLLAELQNVQGQLSRQFRFELLAVDDGSSDDTVQRLERARATHPTLRVLSFSRNFGKEAALTAGLHQAKGDAVIMLDSDLQHPPSDIPRFLEAWQAGQEVVIGFRENQAANGHLRALLTHAFHALSKLTGNDPERLGCTDFRLLDRAVVDEFCRLTEHDRMTRGLIDWLGFRRAYLPIVVPERQSGESKFGLLKLLSLTSHLLVSSSLLPLKLAGVLGVIALIFSLGLGTLTFVDRFVLGNQNFSGPFMSGLFNMFLTSLTLISLGLVAVYTGSIKQDTRNRPLYILRRPHQAGDA